MAKTLEERFWPKVHKISNCWLWSGSKDSKGYGQLRIKSRTTGHWTHSGAHRVSWEIHNGPIYDGLSVLHHCDNPACVRPDHLFVGTQADNMQDCLNKGRKHNQNSEKTHCKYGHPLCGDNLMILPKQRRCLECHRRQSLEGYYRGKAA